MNNCLAAFSDSQTYIHLILSISTSKNTALLFVLAAIYLAREVFHVPEGQYNISHLGNSKPSL
jgi:hypothetical protein